MTAMTSDADRTAISNHAEYTPITVRSGTAPAPKPAGEVEIDLCTTAKDRKRAAVNAYDGGLSMGMAQDIDTLLAALTRERELREAAQAVYDMCLVHGDFHNGVTDSTGTIDEGDVKAWEIIQNLGRALKEHKA